MTEMRKYRYKSELKLSEDDIKSIQELYKSKDKESLEIPFGDTFKVDKKFKDNTEMLIPETNPIKIQKNLRNDVNDESYEISPALKNNPVMGAIKADNTNLGLEENESLVFKGDQTSIILKNILKDILKENVSAINNFIFNFNVKS